MKLNAKTQLQELVWGLLARVVNVLVPVQKGHWIFASDYGRQCREGSKYLLEYMLREHSDYHCTFVTRNSDVRENLSKVCMLKKRSPHVLRHTFATAMLNHDAGIESVRQLLGHESLDTTQIYAHTTFDQLKRVYKDAHPRG